MPSARSNSVRAEVTSAWLPCADWIFGVKRNRRKNGMAFPFWESRRIDHPSTPLRAGSARRTRGKTVGSRMRAGGERSYVHFGLRPARKPSADRNGGSCSLPSAEALGSLLSSRRADFSPRGVILYNLFSRRENRECVGHPAIKRERTSTESRPRQFDRWQQGGAAAGGR